MSPISREPANEAGRSQAWEKTHLQWASDKLKFVKGTFKLYLAGGQMVESLLLLKRKNPGHTALMSFLGQIPKLMRSNNALFDQISQLNFSQKTQITY